MVCVICVYIMAHLFKPDAKKFGSSMQPFTWEVNLPLLGKINPNLKMANLMKLTIDIKGKQSPLK